LWDIAGKAAGKPVCELLGGKVRETVPTKWSVSGVEPAPAAAIARWAVASGFKAMKVKVGMDADRDVDRVRAVRAAIGADIKLGVDANGGWSVNVAVNVIERLSEFDVYFAEQPVSPEDVVHLADVKKRIRIPIIADESVYSLQDAMTLARLNAADVFSIYVGKAGGIGPARKIAEFAQSVGLKCTVGSNLELGVGSAAMVHLAIAMRGIGAEEFPCDIIGPFFYQDDIVRQPLPIVPGEARPSAAPGLGVDLDEDKVERYRVKAR
jgi:L-alanine-DL-glutamate epimerase-like enolase superfamily enzyme